MTTRQPTRDLYAEITNQLIAAIEANPGRPVMPWRTPGGISHLPSNVETGNTYNGINVVSLWVAAASRGFTIPLWGTYRQWQSIGAQVRGGEKSSLIVFYKEFEFDPEGEDDDGKRRMARASYVFNAAQVEGFVTPEGPTALGPIERIETADRFVSATSATIRHGGSSAFFDAAGDYIQMPEEGLFAGTQTMSRTEGYYSVLLHELVHWTGAARRLSRDMSGRFGNAAYAAEELVAEIGSAFLCSELQITPEFREDHAAYVANWLQLLKSDPKAIFAAAARASEAAKYLRQLQRIEVAA